MTRRSRSRVGAAGAVVQCDALEPRRMLCMDDDPAGLSTMPLDGDGAVAAVGAPLNASPAAGQNFSIDTLIVPAFSSDPSSPYKLFLDFNGHHSIDNWGGWWIFGGKDVPTTPAYDIDGDVNSYSSQELANIQQVWKGVAEKFSPFNIDVTTIQPSGNWLGATVVIGGDGAWLGSGGGVALRGEFDFGGSDDATAFVWDAPSDTTYVAESVAHEAGHTLGLFHQSLQPIASNEYADGYIMGAGFNGIGRWANTAIDGTVATSRDDDGVNNEGSQDDVATIAGHRVFLGAFAVGYRTDDVGNSIGSATSVAMSNQGGVLLGSAGGIIEHSNDTDVFGFSHSGGSIDIEVLAAEFRHMLDPRITLMSSTGATIVSSSSNNASDGVGERIQFNSLSAGTYYLSISGSGAYGDLGQYRLRIAEGTQVTAANDTMGTATPLGRFGQTDASSVALGFAGTAVVNDSLTTLDNLDFFKVRTPEHARALMMQISTTMAADVTMIDDLNGDGIVQVGEALGFTSNSSSPFLLTNLSENHTYYFRVRRLASSGNYTLRITADAAPGELPGSTESASFDPQPLEGGRIAYDSIDSAIADFFGSDVDSYRVTAEHDGLFTFYMNSYAPYGDLRLDVGVDSNGNGVLETPEFLATSANAGTGGEYIENLPVTAGENLLVRVAPQTSGALGNYDMEVFADYATGGNATGSLAGARDLTGTPAGSIREYLGVAGDLYDTFKIAPALGQMQATLYMREPVVVPSHRLEIIHDVNGNNQVDAGDVVATGYDGQTLSYNVTSGGAWYLRASVAQAGEFGTIGNYQLVYATAGSTTGFTVGAPGHITVTTPGAASGFLSFDPNNPALTNTQDYYQFTLATRTRLDVSITGPGEGVQIGQLDDQRQFQRIGGIGVNQGVDTSLSVNLDPGTYLLRAYLPVGERQLSASGGKYTMTYKTGAITDNSPPVVTASSFQYQIAPVGVSFTIDQDVFGINEPTSVTNTSISSQKSFAIDKTFYDPQSYQVGYAVLGGQLPDGNYRATLLKGSLRDSATNPLGADYSFEFFVLSGDANRDRKVDTLDFNALAANFGGTGKTFSQADFNYDGTVDTLDFNILAAQFGKNLPPPAARPAAGLVSTTTAAAASSPFSSDPIRDPSGSVILPTDPDRTLLDA